MDQLIPVVNKLQDVFIATGQQRIDLPQIVVIGSQSAGKSSVLENIVGRDFLPRGTGIVTRRPLVLQLYCLQQDPDDEPDPNGEEWGEFLHLPDKRFYNFEEIRKEIERETDRKTGGNKGISNESINLKIFSPHVLNLSLVDLPGITKVPTGDQPADIEEQIRSMCYEFITNPNAIILAVTAANQDLANSDGLKMARSVDPEGLRTVGVLTKVDLMDRGTDCIDILNNEVIPLRRGYIAVVNRSQHDIQTKKTIREGLQSEQAYFQGHPKYRTMSGKCSTANLAGTLNRMLMTHIRECLPEIRARIANLLMEVQNNMSMLGESIDDLTTAQKGHILLQIISKFCDNFVTLVDGKGVSGSGENTKELYGGARISHIFSEIFSHKLKNLDTFEGLSDADIRTTIANANGIRPSLFVPEISFDILVKKQIARLEQPGFQALDMVRDEIQKMVASSETLDLSRFPELREKIFDVTNSLLRSCLKPAHDMIANLVQVELAYINTSHPDFIGGKAAATTVARGAGGGGGQQQQQQHYQQHNMPSAADPSLSVSRSIDGEPVRPLSGKSPVPQGGPPGKSGFVGFFQSPNGGSGTGDVTPKAVSRQQELQQQQQHMTPYTPSGGGGGVVRLGMVPEVMQCRTVPTDKEKVEMEIIKKLMSSYFDIVKKNFIDLVPKTIMHFLVMNFKQNLQNTLVSEVYKEQLMNEVMREDEDNAIKRKAYREMRDLLNRAVDIVNEVRDFQPIK